MFLLDTLLKAKIKSARYDKKEAEGISKQQVLDQLDADTIQLMAALPSGVMDSIWHALGVEDERERKLES